MKAQFVEDGANDDDDDDGDGGPFTAVPSGQTITFSLGNQGCSGTTNASGVAQCNLSVPASLGPQTVSASFAGDAYYRSSSDSKSVIVFPSQAGALFVVADNSVAAATPTTPLTWWNDTWASLTRLSGGRAPDSFKGFAGTVTTLPTTSPANVCGTSFRTLPGNSPPPTSGVPSYMGVLVASSVPTPVSPASSRSQQAVNAATSVPGRDGLPDDVVPRDPNSRRRTELDA